MIFLDTNVFVYASGFNDDLRKTMIARAIIDDTPSAVISVQVLHEFFDSVTRQSALSPLTDEEALALINQWRLFRVEPLTLAVFDHAMAIRARYRFRYYDCAILAAALAGGCDRVLSEGMQHGQIVDGLMIENPFREEQL